MSENFPPLVRRSMTHWKHKPASIEVELSGGHTFISAKQEIAQIVKAELAKKLPGILLRNVVLWEWMEGLWMIAGFELEFPHQLDAAEFHARETDVEAAVQTISDITRWSIELQEKSEEETAFSEEVVNARTCKITFND